MQLEQLQVQQQRWKRPEIQTRNEGIWLTFPTAADTSKDGTAEVAAIHPAAASTTAAAVAPHPAPATAADPSTEHIA